jgi:hypothetical protein
MKQNMGMVDRLLRVVVAIVVGVLYYTGQISGTAAIVLGILAIVFLLTSGIGYCPLYRVINLSTKREQN